MPANFRRLDKILHFSHHLPKQFTIRFLSRILSDPLDISGIRRALIIAPHPDDEVFGCGGLIASLIGTGKEVFLLILTGGEAAHHGCCHMNEELLKETRKNLCHKALQELGLKKSSIHFLSLPDGNLCAIKDRPEIYSEVQGIINKLHVDTVFYPHPYENIPDHETATHIVSRALTNLSLSQFYYCIWIWHRMPFYKAFCLFVNYPHSFRLNIKRFADNKQEAISRYMNPVAPCGKPFSGKLPEAFLHAFKWRHEIFFKHTIKF